jgi:uncharacterized protein YndB with AHSA1/START domain
MTSLTLVRRIKARPPIVFDLVTTAEGIAKWWGPDSGPVLFAKSDPRVGGHYRLRFRTLGGIECETTGEFLEVTRHERVRMTWRWLDDADASLIEMVLRPVPEGTELTFTQSRLPDEATARGHEKGWNGSLDKLEAAAVAVVA